MNPTLLAEVALEVAQYYPDNEKFNNLPRAEWRWVTIELANTIIEALSLNEESEDIDELVINYLSQQEALS